MIAIVFLCVCVCVCERHCGCQQLRKLYYIHFKRTHSLFYLTASVSCDNEGAAEVAALQFAPVAHQIAKRGRFLHRLATERLSGVTVPFGGQIVTTAAVSFFFCFVVLMMASPRMLRVLLGL